MKNINKKPIFIFTLSLFTITFFSTFIHSFITQAATYTAWDEISLQQAVINADAGDTIDLEGDIILTAPLDINKSLNFEVTDISGGQLFTVAGNVRHFNVTGDDVVLKFIGPVLFEGGTFYNENGGGCFGDILCTRRQSSNWHRRHCSICYLGKFYFHRYV